MPKKGPQLEEARNLPIAASIICFVLLFGSIVSLMICFFIWDPMPGRQYYITWCIIVGTSSAMILTNHKFAVPAAFLGALLLTIGKLSEYSALHIDRLSLHSVVQILRFLLGIALNWAAFLWYRSWRLTQR